MIVLFLKFIQSIACLFGSQKLIVENDNLGGHSYYLASDEFYYNSYSGESIPIYANLFDSSSGNYIGNPYYTAPSESDDPDTPSGGDSADLSEVTSLLQSINGRLNSIKSTISNISIPDYSDLISSIKSDVNSIKSDVSAIKSSLSSVNSNVSSIKSDISSINTSLTTISSLISTVSDKLTYINNNLVSFKEIFELGGSFRLYLDEKYLMLYNAIMYGTSNEQEAQETQQKLDNLTSESNSMVSSLNDASSHITSAGSNAADYINTFSSIFEASLALQGISAILELAFVVIFVKKLIGR